MTTNSKLIVDLVLSVGTLVIIFATEPLYNQPLFNWSIDTIPQIQSGLSDFSKSAWIAWSAIGLSIASTLPILIPLLMTLT
jgi:hypothetical protein